MRLILSQFYAFIAILTILRNIKVTASSSFEKSTSGLVSINAYPFGSIASCKQIPQAAVNYCGLNYKTAASSANLAPELTLVIYHILMVITNLPNIQASDQCVQNVKHLYCGLVFPRCDASKSQITFNTTNCYEATGACSSVVNSVIRRIKLCQFAPHGNFELDTCVKPPTISYLHCPSNPNLVTVPKYLILNRILVDVATTYDVDLLRDKGATEQCIQNYVNLLCQSIPFCSPDKKSLMTTVTKEMCYNAVNCLPKSLQTDLKSFFKCNQYPNASSHHIHISHDYTFVGRAQFLHLNINALLLLAITLLCFHTILLE